MKLLFDTCQSFSALCFYSSQVLRKLSSHKYVVENGSNIETALFDRTGNCFAAVIQKLSKGTSAKHSFKLQSCLSSVNFSCSCNVMSSPTTTVRMNCMGPSPSQNVPCKLTKNKTTVCL